MISTALLAVSITAIIKSFMFLLGIVVIFAILYWLTDWIVRTWSLPDIVPKVIYTVLIFGLVFFLVDLILGLFGAGFIEWQLR